MFTRRKESTVLGRHLVLGSKEPGLLESCTCRSVANCAQVVPAHLQRCVSAATVH